MFIYQTLALYPETGSTKNQPRGGSPRDIRTQNRIHAVRECIRRNPLHKQKVMSRDMKISSKTRSRILKADLHLGAYKCATSYLFTEKFKKIRHHRAKQLLQRFKNNAHLKIIFTDKKIFNVEESFNKQNDRVYIQSWGKTSTFGQGLWPGFSII